MKGKNTGSQSPDLTREEKVILVPLVIIGALFSVYMNCPAVNSFINGLLG